MIVLWLKFLLCFLVIVLSGSYLTKLADTLAEKTRLGHTWIGVLLLATVTSLPETFTGIVAVTAADVPNITVGNLFGSCVFNLMMLAVLDCFLRGQSLYQRGADRQIPPAILSLMMILAGGAAIALAPGLQSARIAHVGASSLILIALYLFFMRIIYRNERRGAASMAPSAPEIYPHITLRRALAGFSVAAAFVVGAAVWLPYLGEDLARTMGWNESFVGILFIAAATTTPEFVVTVTILRMGIIHLAFGNLLGSNLYNIALLGALDVLYMRGALAGDVSRSHLIPAAAATLMTCVVIAGFARRPKGVLFGRVAWPSLALMILFAANALVLYVLQR